MTAITPTSVTTLAAHLGATVEGDGSVVITGSTLRPRPVDFKGAIARSLREKIWPLIEAGRIKPVIYKSFPLAQASEAHRLMESSQHIGKIVLEV